MRRASARAELESKSEAEAAQRLPAARLVHWPIIIITGPAMLFWTGWIVYRNYLKIAAPYGRFVSIFWRLLAAGPAILAQGLARDAAMLGAFWLIAVQAGRPILSALSIRCATRLEQLLFAGGLGSGLLSLLLFALGLCRWWSPAILSRLFWTATALSLTSLLIERRRRPAETRPAPPIAAGRPGYGVEESAAALLLACAATMTLLCTAAPEMFYDSLLYHLALPKLYLINQRIFATPHNAYSGAPQGVQMLFGLMLSLGDERLTAMLNWSFAALTALALHHFAGRYSRPAGALSALLFFTAPVTMYAASCSGADLAGSYFCALSFFALLRMAETPPRAPDAPDWPICAGMLLGLAMGAAYNVFPIAALLTAGIFRLGGHDRARKALRAAAAALLFVAPWLLKNIVFFGNPLYPVFSSFLRPDLGPADLPGLLSVAGARRLSVFATINGWKEFLQFPWTISESLINIDNWPGPAFLLLLPWIVLSRWRGAHKTAAAYALIAYLAWSVPNTVGRFILPALPMIAYTAALALHHDGPRWLRHAGWLGALCICLINLQAECHQGVVTQRWTALAERRSKADFLNEEHLTYPLPSYSAIEFMNTRLPPDAKILFVGDARAFYCDRNVVAAGVYNSNPLWTAVRTAASAAEIRQALVRDGITHIFLNAKGVTWASSDTLLPRTQILAAPFDEFWSRHLDLLFTDNDRTRPNPKWLFVYSLRDRPKEKIDPGFLNPPRMAMQSLAAH